MTVKRRVFLKGSLAAGVAVAAASAGLLSPRRALAAKWPSTAFSAKGIEDALQKLYGTNQTIDSTEVQIRAPLQAENGAQVPIEVSSGLADARTISVFVNENAYPLAASITLQRAAPFFKARIKMAKTSDVKVVVDSGGKLYTASQTIKVTAGGCGG